MAVAPAAVCAQRWGFTTLIPIPIPISIPLPVAVVLVVPLVWVSAWAAGVLSGLGTLAFAATATRVITVPGALALVAVVRCAVAYVGDV